ncbi:MAG: AAA family ATPase [Bacteroidales bacterium]|jgi:hypothetical protein|nr:AAA family ATPase [Bacteroidales bacterium]
MDTNPQRDLANNFVEYTGHNIFLTGKAGTGKTTFLRQLKARSPKRMIVVAPTGVAAINAGGMTIHSFFQLSFAPQVGDESNQAQQKRFNKTKINIIRTLDLLVIDEISMVRADVLDAIDKVLRRYRKRDKPFGGVQLLMIGDLQQLAPVVKNNEWNMLRDIYETVFFFSSLALSQTSYVSIELTHVYRQQDDKFINILNKVRDNKLDRASSDELNKRFIPDFKIPENSDYITLCTHNAQAKRLNDKELVLLDTTDGVMQAKIEGNFPEYSYPTEEELHLKEGAQVMFVKNDPEPEKRFYNGKIGKITHISKGDIRVMCPGDLEEIDVSPLVWENVKYTVDEKTAEIKEEIEGTFEQIPLKTAWAITIHKSQGLTFEHAVIDAQGSFAHGQVYVALSRCKTLEGMVLSSKIAEKSIISDRQVSGFIHNVEENQPDDAVLQDCKNSYQRDVIFEVFDYSRMIFLIRGVLRVAQENRGAFQDDFVKAIDEMNVGITEQLLNVGIRFGYQVKALLDENSDAEANPALQDRVIKGGEYFSAKLQELLLSKLSLFSLEVDNKAIAKQINRYIDDLQDEINMKVKLLEVCKVGFTVKSILDARAKKSIAKAKIAKTKPDALPPSFENIEHPKLYHELRRFRSEKAEESGMPAYYVFSQKTLAELLKYMPVDDKSLKKIKGIGAVKVRQFGAEILEIITDYCRNNDVERGLVASMDFSEPKEKKPKIDTKQVSYDMYKSGKSVPEIAKKRDLNESTIFNHLTTFVATGLLKATEFVEENKLKEIATYFGQTKNYSIGDAKARFGSKADYGELRMALSYYLSQK